MSSNNMGNLPLEDGTETAEAAVKEQPISHVSFSTYDPDVVQMARWTGPISEFMPWEYNGWQAETLSWKTGCYLHGGLSSTMPDLRVKGPDAERLMSENFVNGFTLEKFPVGKGKHAIALSPEGNVISHGLVMRLAEDEFACYSVVPIIVLNSNNGKYDVEPIEYVMDQDFVFQIAGPTSLQVCENALEEDIHDLGFMCFRYGKVAGRDVRVIRMGMGGTISYEIQGRMEDALPVWDKIVEVGRDYGLERMGKLAYMCNHTENGFPQYGTHFMRAVQEYPELYRFMGFTDETKEETNGGIELHGSMSDQGYAAYFANPIELGWSRCINWNHDFVGKDALLKIKADPSTRRIVTLEWNAEDILNIFRAYYDKEDMRMPDLMCYPQNYYFAADGQLADKVLDGQGRMVGRSSGIVYTQYYKKTISQALIDPEYAAEGTELTLIWGTAGTRQIPIRVRVARYPYLDLTSNRDFDLETIPHYKG